jgi:chromosome segregation ATPase
MGQYMFIELLWIIPIIGFGIFVSILVFLLHNKYSGNSDMELKRQVKEFNSGAHHAAKNPQPEKAAQELEKRLSELEGAIASLTKSIAVHQKTVDSIASGGVNAVSQESDLQNMLGALHREYDAILHENRTLRTQFMKFLNDEGKAPKVSQPAQPKTNLQLFDDTRQISPENFEDTADLDLLGNG